MVKDGNDRKDGGSALASSLGATQILQIMMKPSFVTTLSSLGSDLTSLLLVMKDKNNEEGVVNEVSDVVTPKDIIKEAPPRLCVKGLRMQYLIEAIFRTPSEWGSKSPSQKQDIKTTVVAPMEEAIETPEPEKETAAIFLLEEGLKEKNQLLISSILPTRSLTQKKQMSQRNMPKPLGILQGPLYLVGVTRMFWH